MSELIPLMATMREELGYQVDTEVLVEQVDSMMKQRDGRLVVLAARDGRFPVGYVAGSFCMDPLSRGLSFMITEVFISRPFRGGRVLKELMHGLDIFVREREATTIFALLSRTDRDITSLAESLGFDNSGKEMIERIL